ncbi:MAG: CRTAC1 family protein [Rhodothermales bacterium]
MLFTEITEQAGLGGFQHTHGGFGEKWFPEIMGSGGGLIDYNDDGWLDVLLVRGGSLPGQPEADVPALALYRNNGLSGSGPSDDAPQPFPTFTDITSEAGLGEVRAYGFGVAAADYDNDGDEDVLLTTLGKNLLFRNDGGVFQEVGEAAGIADAARWSTSALFFDANRDGHLDLYVANYVDWTPETDVPCAFEGIRDYCSPWTYSGVANTFYHGNGDGTFTNRTEEAGFLSGTDAASSKSLGVGELDFNQDGWPDVYVANDGERNALFANNGDPGSSPPDRGPGQARQATTFSEIALRSGVALDQNGTPRAGMGVDAGVVDSSGETTILVGNYTNETVSVWRHEGAGFFADRVAASGVGASTSQTLTFGLALLDVDLDTDLDLLLANGHVLEQVEKMGEGLFREPAQLFLNRGDGTFDAASPQGPLAKPMLARGLAAGDIDHDGDLDVLLTENNGPVHLWCNDLKDGHFLRVRLQGTESNRDGLGARVRATASGLVMERRVRTGGSYLSQSEKTVTFGLGSSRDVALEVAWPSGRTEQFERVAPDQEVVLVEGSGQLAPSSPSQPLARR